MLYIFLGVLAVLSAGGYLVLFTYHGRGYLSRRPANLRGEIAWLERGPTPHGDKGYTPQGLTWVEGRLIFANSWKNTRSRVYEFDPETMECLRFFDMPPEAVHTSGLAWDGSRLWAVDYISNRGYAIDLEASLAAGQVSLIGQFATTLRGTSACCLLPWEGQQVLAISDFMRTARTMFVWPEESLAAGTVADSIVFSYTNEGFSQGLEFFDGFLYESENKRGTDVINRLDLEKLAKTRSARRSTVKQYAAPNGGVEDLAYDGRRLWTSDECTFRFYCAELPD